MTAPSQFGWFCRIVVLSACLAAAAPGANAGDAAAKVALAQRYENAEGVKRDLARALELYCEASRQGDGRAAYAIGWMVLNGRGMPHDDAIGAGWLRLAAARGETQATRVLAHLGAVVPAPPTGCKEPEPVAATPPAPPAPAAIVRMVARIAAKYHVDPNLVLAVMATESAFDAAAVSPKNAKGLMQLMPDTAQRFGVKDVLDPADNIGGGIRYLRWLTANFAGDLSLVLAAYNAGEGAVERYGGVPPYPETRAYVERVRQLYGARPNVKLASR